MLLGSVVAAFVWWAYLPEPPFPERLLMMFAPAAKLITSNQVPDALEMLVLLGIWFYVILAILTGLICLKVSGSYFAAKGPNHQFRRTPNGAAEQ